MPIVDQRIEHELTVQRSRFMALLFPASSLDEAKRIVRKRHREIKRANHHCWACRLPAGKRLPIEQARDDGEVGRPGLVMLELLRHHDLFGGIVVSRIFGGVKLGAGGVARAFRQVAEETVASSRSAV